MIQFLFLFLLTFFIQITTAACPSDYPYPCNGLCFRCNTEGFRLACQRATCFRCKAGAYVSPSNEDCTNCPAGTYLPEASLMTYCYPCPA